MKKLAFGVSLLLLHCVGDTPVASGPGVGDAAVNPQQDALAPIDAGCGDTTKDAKNCGTCGNVCHDGFSCAESHCGNEIVEVTAGGYGSCAVLRDGSLECWGSNQEGQLGIAPSANDKTCAASTGSVYCRTSPIKIAGLGPVSHVALASNAKCALLLDGTVWCFGDNSAGLLGHDPSTDVTCSTTIGGAANNKCSSTPQQVIFPGSAKVKFLAGKIINICAITEAGDLYCWGDNSDMMDGVAETKPFLPTKLGVFASDAVSVYSNFHACAIRNSGANSVWCWGSDFEGQLGHAPGAGCSGNCDPTPQIVNDAQANALSGAIAVATSDQTSCAVLNTGVVDCWGGGGLGELGDGTATQSRAAAAPAKLPNNIVSLTGFYNGFSAHGSDGKNYFWGRNDAGQLGLGSTAFAQCGPAACVTTPAENVALAGFQVSTAIGGGVAVDAKGKVVAWGTNSTGELAHFPGDDNDAKCGADFCATSPVEVTGFP